MKRRLTEEEYWEADREYTQYLRDWEDEWDADSPWPTNMEPLLDFIPWLETQGIYLYKEGQ